MANISEPMLPHRSIEHISKNVQNNAIILTFENPQQTQEAARIIKSDERELTQSVERNNITLNFSDAMEKRIKEDAVLRNIEVLRTRLDRFSVAEISIAKQGDKIQALRCQCSADVNSCS